MASFCAAFKGFCFGLLVSFSSPSSGHLVANIPNLSLGVTVLLFFSLLFSRFVLFFIFLVLTFCHWLLQFFFLFYVLSLPRIIELLHLCSPQCWHVSSTFFLTNKGYLFHLLDLRTSVSLSLFSYPFACVLPLSILRIVQSILQERLSWYLFLFIHFMDILHQSCVLISFLVLQSYYFLCFHHCLLVPASEILCYFAAFAYYIIDRFISAIT